MGQNYFFGCISFNSKVIWPNLVRSEILDLGTLDLETAVSPGGYPELKEPKTRIFNEMKEITASFDPPIDISLDGNTFTQFLCDPSSFNLPPKHRVNLNNNEECDKRARPYRLMLRIITF